MNQSTHLRLNTIVVLRFFCQHIFQNLKHKFQNKHKHKHQQEQEQEQEKKILICDK